MTPSIRIRPARMEDALPLLAIYRPYVEDTVVSFEVAPPTLEEFTARIQKALAKWAWLVAEEDGQCVGYAYGSMHRERAAYRYSTEVSAYVAASARRRGIGALLYRELFTALAARGYCNALAGVALPNAASVALHESVGFTAVGVFRNIGWKFGSWHDVAWFEKQLRDSPTSFSKQG